MGAKVGVPVVDAGVDARVGSHISHYCHQQLHDVIDPELSRSILENIENLLGVRHDDVKWFPYLLRLGSLGPLILSFLHVYGERLGGVGVYLGRILCGGGCGGVWRDGCRSCSYRRCDCVQYLCNECREDGGTNFQGPVVALGVACVWRRVA